MRTHVNKAHQLYRAEFSAGYSLARLQSWHTGTRTKYWQAPLRGDQGSEGGEAAAAAVAAAAAGDRPNNRRDNCTAKLLEEMEEQECARLELLAQDHLTADAKVSALFSS